MDNNIVLVSLPIDQLKQLIHDAVQTSIHEYKESQNVKELLSMKELCTFLNINISTAYKWKREGKLPYKCLGKRIYFPRTQIVEAMEDINLTKFNELRSVI